MSHSPYICWALTAVYTEKHIVPRRAKTGEINNNDNINNNIDK